MSRTKTLAFALTVAAAVIGVAHAVTPSVTHSDPVEIRSLIKVAHTPNDYLKLASYFRTKQQTFEEQAKVEKQEWDRRSQNTASLAEKYPRPVDSSRNRYEYFSYEAGKMKEQAAHFETLAANAQ